ncbi:enediyne biosynthesis protein UnbU [Streptosporangium amethystogenes]|uniref:enediyne biosynthesis protein UnbU n=1 Tax=Streptosporangium amethystogenes TaxID=2002 RepID=UPI0037919CD7
MSAAPPPETAKPRVSGLNRGRALRRSAWSLTLITVLGHTVLGFEQSCLAPVVGALTGVTTEFALETVEAWAWRRPARYLGVPRDRVADFFLPSYIRGLLCAMLLYGNGHLMPIVLAVLIGVGSTYLFRVRAPEPARTAGGAGTTKPARRTGGDAPGVAFLNPVAFGIVVVLLLFPWVGLAPAYQFTAWVSGPFDLIVPLAVLAGGVVAHAGPGGRLPLVLGWTGGFALQACLRGGLGDVSTVGALLPMTGTAFALYTGYVITDPGASPVRARDQVVFGLTTAAVYGLLVQFHVVFGPFLALVIVCTGRGLKRLRRPPGTGRPARGGQPMPGPIRSSTRSEPSCRTSLNAPEASTRW